MAMKCAYKDCSEIIKGGGNYCENHSLWSGTISRVLDDRDLETEGKVDRAGGDLQEGFGTARRKVGESIEDIGDSIKR